MNNGNINPNNFPKNPNYNNNITENTVNYQLNDNVDMKNFMEDNNLKDTVHKISVSNDFCIICEVDITKSKFFQLN